MNSPGGAAFQATTSPQNAYGPVFWFIYFANVALLVCNSSLFRYFDFVHFLGGDEYDLGLITGLGMAGGVLSRFVQGAVIDRLGPRVIWLGSLSLMVASLLGHFWVERIDSPLIYVLRLVYMVGLAGAFGASITAVSLRAPRGRTTELIGVLGSSGFIGQAIGPMAGDAIFTAQAPLAWKIQMMFSVALGACCISMLLTWLATWGERPRVSRKHPSMFRLIRQYHAGWMLLMAFALGMGIQFPQVFLRGFAKEVGIAHIGSFFLVYTTTAFTFRLLTRRLPERIGVKNAATIGVLILAASLTLYLLVSNPWLLPVPAFLGGLAHALTFPAIIGGGSIAFPKKYRGMGTNLMLVMLDAGALFGQPLIGTMIATSRKFELPAYPLTFTVIGILLATFALLNHQFAKPVQAMEDDLPEIETRAPGVVESS